LGLIFVRALNSNVLRENWQHGKEKKSFPEAVCSVQETSCVALQKQSGGQILQTLLSQKVEGKQ